jgi:hypothetical protein
VGIFGGQKDRHEAAKSRKEAVIASLGSGMNRRIEVFDDRVEVFATHSDVVASQNLDKAQGRHGWKVMPYETGVEAEVIAGDPGSAATQRLTITRMVGLGVFALAAPKKKGGSKPTAILAIANGAGQFIGIVFAADKMADGKMVEIALNFASEKYREARTRNS